MRNCTSVPRAKDREAFPNHKGEHFFRTYTWRHDETREASGVEKKGRLLHSYRHTGARHAASGLWGEKWSRAEVSKLIRDTSPQAVDRYFDILDEAMEEKTNAMKQDLTLLTASGDGSRRLRLQECEETTLPLSYAPSRDLRIARLASIAKATGELTEAIERTRR